MFEFFGSNPVFAKANRYAISIDTVYVTIFVLATTTQASHAPITIRDMAAGSIFHKTMIFFHDITANIPISLKTTVFIDL